MAPDPKTQVGGVRLIDLVSVLRLPVFDEPRTDVTFSPPARRALSACCCRVKRCGQI